MQGPVNFTRPAAERIARAVRVVEIGSRDGSGPVYDRPWYGGAGGSAQLKLGTFTGNWPVESWQTVTLYGSTETAEVYNWCNPATGVPDSDSTSTRYVIFCSVSGTQSVVEIATDSTLAQECSASMTLQSLNLASLPNYSEAAIQMLGHAAKNTNSTCSGGLQWYSITTCATAMA